MKRSISLFTLLVLLGTGLKSYGGDVYQALDAGDVFVATITRVEDKGATNAAPPQVWFTVHEVLRGKKDVARSPAVWSPPYHGIDYGDDDLPELRLWNATPLPGPKVGEKFILERQSRARPAAKYPRSRAQSCGSPIPSFVSFIPPRTVLIFK